VNPHRLPSFLLVLTVLAAPAVGQVSPGFRLLNHWAGNDVQLVDTNGTIVHTWNSAFTASGGLRMLPDGSIMRSKFVAPGPVPPGGGSNGGVERIALDGTVLWQYTHASATHWTHHDIEVMPNGNVLLAAWEWKTVAEAVAAGRNPALISGTVFRPDYVVEVQPTGPTTGTIVWEWHVWDHLIQDFDATKANFGVVADHPELVDINYPAIAGQASDWNHVNALHYDAVNDWVIIGTPFQHEVWIVDHSTTTAEAAGHTGGNRGKGGDLLYRWGNPQAYKRGTFADQKLFGQHGCHTIPPGLPGAGNMLVFNNNSPGGSSVVEFVLPCDAQGNFPALAPGAAWGPAQPAWTHQGGFQSNVQSSARRLPNGNTLIDSAVQFRVFEVTPAHQEIWTYTWTDRIFQAFYVDRTLWADKATLSASAGGTVKFDVIAGSPHAGRSYWLLASISGMSPGTTLNGHLLALNYDSVFQYTIDNANTPILTTTNGVLSATGRATAFLNLPPGMITPVHADFAVAVYDAATLTVQLATNTVPVDVGP
jgi:hypothetical protein